MQDSIQLSDSQQKSINILISPENKKLSKFKFNSNTVSQKSLVYSNSTLQKDNQIIRSPHIDVQNFDHSQFKFNSQTRIRRKSSKDNDGSIFQKKQSKLYIDSPEKDNINNVQVQNHKMERKTLSKPQYIKLQRKNKELQTTLQLQTIVSQELRSKLRIAYQMLQTKSKDSGINEILKMKNSSKDLKNIDIFIQMKNMKGKINEKDVTIQKLRDQNNKLLSEIKVCKQKKLKEHINNELNTINENLELEQLREEKQSLFNYIQQLKVQFQRKEQHSKYLQAEVERLIKKQSNIEIERQKITKEIIEKTNKNRQLQRQTLELKMANNLLQGKQRQTNQEHEIQIIKLEEKYKQELSKCKEAKKICDVNSIEIGIQTLGVNQMQIMRAQLCLLKTERDYYLNEFRKKIEQNSEIYELRLKLNQYNKQY